MTIPAGLIALLLTFTSPASGQEAEIELLDRVAAIVGNSVIMDSEIEDRIDMTRDRLVKSKTPLPPQDVLESQVMDQLIVESLLKQRAQKSGIQVTADEMNAAIQQLADRNNTTPEGFYQSLTDQGFEYEDFLIQLKDDLLLQKINQAQVRPRVKITEEEIRRFLESTAGEALLGREYLVHHIMLPIDDDRATTDQLAAKLLKKINDGENFEAVAVEHSQARTALKGGELGWRKPSQLPEVLAKAVQKLKVGDIAGPIDDGFALHLIRLTDRRGDSIRYAEEVKLRHILLKPSALRTLEQAQEEIGSIRRRIEVGEDFAALARIHSEDPNSALSGGDLGWVQEEQLPPAFIQALNKTKEKELSEPFATETGWHIAQVLERRTADLTEETGRNRAYQLLFERKFEEELTRYMHEIRSQAYVELKERTDKKP